VSRSKRLLLAAAFLVLIVVTHRLWLTALASFLILNEKLPAHADVIVVLAGDGTGRRILKAAALARDGVAPLVMVSGPNDVYGIRESYLAIEYAVKEGFARSLFRPVNFDAESTREEAEHLAQEIRSYGARSLIVVTSNYHTRRAGLIFRRLNPNVQVSIAAAPAPPFTAETWWHTRTGRKMFLQEWMKTIAGEVGL
jgi:uncharacterized SAM-binding protein YcdF (DUF218 family)